MTTENTVSTEAPQLVFFTKDEQVQKANLLKQLGSCTTAEDFAKIQEKLLALNINENKAKNSLKVIFDQLANFNIGFNELLNAGVFTASDVRTYAEAQGWTKELTDSEIKQIATEKFNMVVDAKAQNKKLPFIIGTFKTADFPEFVVEKDDAGNKLVADEFVWDLFKRYGPTPNNKFVNAIKAKGYEWVIENATNSEALKEWLKVNHKATVGRAVNSIYPIYDNGREFLFRWDIKPADADKIIHEMIQAGKLEPKAEEVVESQTVQDEFVQEAPKKTTKK